MSRVLSRVVTAEADSTSCVVPDEPNPDTYVGNYKIVASLGRGSFNEAYLGIWNNKKHAVKVELSNASHRQLRHELMVYREVGMARGFPQIYRYEEYYYERVSGKTFNFLAMERLGPSLAALFHRSSLQFSMRSVLIVGEQVLCRLETLHSRGYIHRDLKPDNLLIGEGSPHNERTIFLIDFGMAIKYWDSAANKHKPILTQQRSVGTIRYSSINTHLGILQSRRDDLETLLYVLIFFLRGSLPWSCSWPEHMTPAEKHEAVYQLKSGISPEELCYGYPAEFAMYLRYCRMLQYEERPNYDYLHGLLKKAAGSMDINLNDEPFERSPFSSRYQ